MKLIIGLGNPGAKYQNTRHNLGFRVLDEYAKKHLGPKIKWEEDKASQSEILKLGDVWLAKPQTFMNNSGMSIAQITNYYRIDLENVVVIHDELDLPLGKIKIRIGGSAAGHHGVESIIKSLGDDKFTRIRLGIGNLRTESGERGQVHINADKFVLEPFAPTERPKIKHMLKQVQQALEVLLTDGIEQAQNRFH